MQRPTMPAARCTPQVAAQLPIRRPASAVATAALRQWSLSWSLPEEAACKALTGAPSPPPASTADDASALRGGTPGGAWTAEGSRSGRMLGALRWRPGSKAGLRGGSLHG